MAKESKPKAASAHKPVAKKTTKTAGAARKTTTKSAAAKSARGKKPAQAAGTGGAPMVDTSFAAEAAARMLSARVKLGNAPAPSKAAEQRESGAFKQMKESINKPAAGGMAAAMGNTFGPNKTNLPNPDKGHVVRDQTTSNVNRVNVPRRTGG
jgi:hypothetical protein